MSSFDFLCGAIRLRAKKPLGFNLSDFYEKPNDTAGIARHAARILFHESVHFWQLLSWGYVARLHDARWKDLRAFEATGELGPVPDVVEAFRAKHPLAPFSALELFECWARFWDVHTANPRTLLEESKELGEQPAYHSGHFDFFMTTGRDAIQYAAPYRFLLRLVGNDTYLLCCLFPAVVHAAFCTDDPVLFVAEAFATARARIGRDVARPANMNLAWVTNWALLETALVTPTQQHLDAPKLGTGLAVLRRGAFAEHPLYGDAADRLMKNLRRQSDEAQRSFATADWVDKVARPELRVVFEALRQDLRTLLAHPGEPEFRTILGRSLPPPRVLFGDEPVDSFSKEVLDRLFDRVNEYAGARKALAFGLPLDAFRETVPRTGVHSAPS